MNASTKRVYENRVAALETLLNSAEKRANQNASQALMYEEKYYQVLRARRQGVEARQWAIKQAIDAGQRDVVEAAKQIADYVYGSDINADRELETS